MMASDNIDPRYTKGQKHGSGASRLQDLGHRTLRLNTYNRPGCTPSFLLDEPM